MIYQETYCYREKNKIGDTFMKNSSSKRGGQARFSMKRKGSMNKKLNWMAAMGLCATALAGDYSSWVKYRNITLGTTGITTTSVNRIPILIRFNEATQSDMFTGADAVLANGADLRFTKTNGTTDLPFEVDYWTTGAGGSGAVWVLLDSVTANNSSAYSLKVYWSKSGATTASAPTTVFDTANGFLSVWHMNEGAGANLFSATGNGPAAAPGSGSAQPTNNPNAVIGAGKTFSAASAQFYQVGSDSTSLRLNSNTGPYTITAWANPSSCSARIAVIAKYANDNSTGTRQYALHTANSTDTWRMTNNPTLLSNQTSNNEYVADVSGSCIEGSWTYLSGTYSTGGVQPTADATGAAFVTLSVNGAVAVTGVTANQATGTSIGTAANTFIGKIASNERYMDGSIDEITVSKVTRTADWTKLSYETQKPGSTALSIGSSTANLAGAPSIASQPTNRSATVGTTVKFGVVATGTGPLAYKWVHRNTDTVGTNSDTLTLSNVAFTDTGSYKCVVRNSVSVTVSNSATLSVTPVALLPHRSAPFFNVRLSGSAIIFQLPGGEMQARVSVLDMKGREVWTRIVAAGSREFSWDGVTTTGTPVAPGVYSVRLFLNGVESARSRLVISR
jgi:hypothetical protein